MSIKIDDAVLAGALEYWRGVKLSDMLRELDTASLEIVDNQKTSLQERRKLAEKTKEFRSVPDDQKATEFKPLLRAYQNEIDALTKRMKYAENSFLRVVQSLGSAPDPEPFLAGLSDERKLSTKHSETQEELLQMSKRVQALEEENSRLRSQGSDAEQLQRQVRQLESRIEEQVKQQTAQRELEIKEQYEDLVKHLKEREGDLQHQLSAANRTVVQLQSTFDSEEAERRSQGGSADRELVSKLAELDILQSDLDHANARLVDMQAQNTRLRSELATLTGSGDGSGAPGETLADYRRRVLDLEEETKRLFDRLEKSEASLAQQEAKHSAASAVAESEYQAKVDELKRLRAELRRRGDYDEIRRDLDIMKSVEFSVSDWGMDDAATSSSNAKDAEAGAEPLEMLLARRNKTLENRLTDARNELDRSQKKIGELAEQCDRLTKGLADKTALAERLEADILAVQPADEQPGATAASGEPAEAATEGRQGGMAGSSGLLDIVTGQRDRFRQRNIELEDELREQTISGNEVRRQAEQLKQDNLRLYEEIKYLRSYTSTVAGSSGTATSSHNASAGMMHLGKDSLAMTPSKFSSSSSFSNGGRVQIDVDTGVAAKYKGMYEESLNPFNVFHRRETTRRVRSMGVLDRLVYLFSQFVMGSRRARLAMLGYAALLHILVFFTLYRSMLIADESTHDRALPPPLQ
ncbi:hypothetical protein GGI07_003150 [Coemansia sp. Benny D115]|nr:hypothetical protein GGI07_003150 [Coemansia sp. Benny D115]